MVANTPSFQGVFVCVDTTRTREMTWTSFVRSLGAICSTHVKIPIGCADIVGCKSPFLASVDVRECRGARNVVPNSALSTPPAKKRMNPGARAPR